MAQYRVELHRTRLTYWIVSLRAMDAQDAEPLTGSKGQGVPQNSR